MNEQSAGGAMVTEIDHVAIAVRDLDAAIAWYQSALGARLAHRERVEHDGVEEATDLCSRVVHPAADTDL